MNDNFVYVLGRILRLPVLFLPAVLLAIAGTRCPPQAALMFWLAVLFQLLVCALALLPVALVAGPFLYAEAWFLLLLGVASRLVPALELALAGWETRVPTGRLNSWLTELTAATPPPVRGGAVKRSCTINHTSPLDIRIVAEVQ